MNFKTFLESMSTQALDVLDGFDYEAAIEAGVDPTRARAWRQLHDIYFGPTKSRQKQRLATEKARRYGFSLDQLAMIERRLRPTRTLENLHVPAVFLEPQLAGRSTVLTETAAQLGIDVCPIWGDTLDPPGSGPADTYIHLVEANAASIRRCLGRNEK